MRDDHDGFVQAALGEFPGSAVEYHRTAAEIHTRILGLLGYSLDRSSAIPVCCPHCSGQGCLHCQGGRLPFARVRNHQGARLDLGLRILSCATKTAEPENKHWMALAVGALERRRAQLSEG